MPFRRFACLLCCAAFLAAGPAWIQPQAAFAAEPSGVETAPAAKPAKKKAKKSRDFLQARNKKPAASKAATEKSDGVRAGDLMDAMKENIEAGAPAALPPEVPSVPPAPPTVMEPMSANSLAPEPRDTPPMAQVPPVPKEIEHMLAPAIGEEVPPPSPKGESREELRKEEARPSPPATREPELASPPKAPAGDGPPLLSTLAEPPKGAPAPQPEKVPEKVREKVPEKSLGSSAGSALPPVTPRADPAELPPPPPGFAKPRPLFSAPGKKARAGTESSGLAPALGKKEEKGSSLDSLPPPPTPAAAKEKLPDLPAREIPLLKQNSIISPEVPGDDGPKSEKKDIWKDSDNAPASAGAVTYMQEAGGEGREMGMAPPPPAAAREEERRDTKQSTGEEKLPESAPELAPTRAAAASSSSGGLLHGSCGAANGVGSTEKPSDNLCTQGQAGNVTGNGPWSWKCKGEKGGSTASCSAPMQIDGECGMANGSQSAAAPIGHLCSGGKASDVTGTGPWHWNCFGDNGGTVAQCVAYTLVSGRCGDAHNMAAREAPKSGLCASGKATTVSGEGPWTWSCAGSTEGKTIYCTAPRVSDGACGTAANMGSATTPRTNLCSIGKPSKISGEGPWTWTCAGDHGGQAATCTTPLAQNAACGSAHGVGVTQAPVDGLCSMGVASGGISGSGPWYWTCKGENGGAASDCMAPRRMDGLCGSAHQSGSDSAPMNGLCSAGTPGPVTGSGPWQWSCAGASGGLTANCLARPSVHAECGSAHGVSTRNAPGQQDLCTSGTPTTVIGSGPFTWSCEGRDGGAAVNCMAPLQINGACGAADGIAVIAAPSSDLCGEGEPSSVSGTGPWVWTCKGAGSGISSTCSAPIAEQASAPPSAKAETPGAPPGVPRATEKAGNECMPTVKRWTITCQQGGYPVNYTGVIVGETQVLCPTSVERGVWLSNSCAPASDSMPVSPEPGVLLTPQLPPSRQIVDVLPPTAVAPLPVKSLGVPAKKLKTPRYAAGTGAAPASPVQPAIGPSTISFSPGSEGMDSAATSILDEVNSSLVGDDKTILTLNAYAALPSDGNQQESRRLALARALSVRSYLMRKGLPSNRIDIRALGPAPDKNGDDRVDVLVGGR